MLKEHCCLLGSVLSPDMVSLFIANYRKRTPPSLGKGGILCSQRQAAGWIGKRWFGTMGKEDTQLGLCSCPLPVSSAPVCYWLSSPRPHISQLGCFQLFSLVPT